MRYTNFSFKTIYKLLQAFLFRKFKSFAQAVSRLIGAIQRYSENAGNFFGVEIHSDQGQYFQVTLGKCRKIVQDILEKGRFKQLELLLKVCPFIFFIGYLINYSEQLIFRNP